MTRAALEFVGAITFEAVTGRRSYTEIFGPGNALDHIKLAREASVIVVAPATADFIGARRARARRRSAHCVPSREPNRRSFSFPR